MTGQPIWIVTSALVFALTCTTAGTADARPSGSRATSGSVTDGKAKRRETRPTVNEKIRICCRSWPRVRYYRAHPQTCRQRGHHVVKRSWCSGRKTGGQNGLVCCIRKSLDVVPFPKVKSHRVLTTREKCEERGSGWREYGARACAKKRTVADRKRDCEKRGKGWTWKENRCVRAQLRDRRNR